MEPTADIPSPEILFKHPKVEHLIKEFGLLPPSQNTLQEVKDIFALGLPLTKSMKVEAAMDFLTNGILLTDKTKGTGTMDVLYTSAVVNKGYGPVAAIISPSVMKENRFTGFCVDDCSTYVTHRCKTERLSRSEIMQDYTLTPDELKEMFAYCLASFTDQPPYLYYSIKKMEESLRFIRFDIGLPRIELQDIVKTYTKTGHSDLSKEQSDHFKMLAEQKNIPFEELYLIYNGSSFPHGTEITNRTMDQYHIPQKFRDTLRNYLA